MNLKDILKRKKRFDVLGRPMENIVGKLPPRAIFDEVERLHKNSQFMDAIIDITFGSPIEFPPNPEQIKALMDATPDDLWHAYLIVTSTKGGDTL